MSVKCDFEGCGRWFVRKFRLDIHKKIHTGERDWKCEVEGCKYSYYAKQDLDRHVKRVHANPTGSYKCVAEGCLATFDSVLRLASHSRSVHNRLSLLSKQLLSCSFCESKFSKKWQVKEHESSHTNTMPFKCDLCQESFREFISFRKHRSSAHEPHEKKIHKCQEKDCLEVFEKWTDYLLHRKQTHNGVVKCDVCDRMFSKVRLKQHKKVHNESRTVHICPNEDCARYYFFPRNLKQHIRSAHEGKGYFCDVCSQKLSTNQKLQEHIKKMHGTTPNRVKTRGKSRKALLGKFVGVPGNIDVDVVRPDTRKTKRRSRVEIINFNPHDYEPDKSAMEIMPRSEVSASCSNSSSANHSVVTVTDIAQVINSPAPKLQEINDGDTTKIINRQPFQDISDCGRSLYPSEIHERDFQKAVENNERFDIALAAEEVDMTIGYGIKRLIPCADY